MRKLFVRLTLFSLPILLLCLLLTVGVDPYNYFNIINIVPVEVKTKHLPDDGILANVIEFRRNPCENVILGGSQAAKIDVDYVKRLTGERYAKMYVSGANAATMKDLFMYMSKVAKLKNVYIGTSFHLFSDKGGDPFKQDIGDSRIAAIVKKADSPIYFVSNKVTRLSLDILINYYMSNKIKHKGKPYWEKDGQWKYFLTEYGDNIFRSYNYSTKYLHDLKDIANYCKDNNINIHFILFPNHADLHDKIKEYQLVEAEQLFKKDIGNLGVLHDLDFDNEITRDISNYEDPFHLKESVAYKVTKEIWGKKNRPKLSYRSECSLQPLEQTAKNRSTD